MSQQQESKLLTAEFVSASLSKAELLRRLGKLYKFLKSMKQDNRSKSMLDSTAATLVQKELLTHKNSEVRLLTACCLADIIRIYAPDAPYDHSMISQVFKLFIQQLQRIGEVEDESFHLRFALLEKLAVVKAFIILVDKEDELLVQVFKTFFDAITPEHSVLVVTHMLDIMTSCLEECEEIPLELLDAILVNLLAKNKQEHPPSYLLARQLVQGCAELLQAAITQFLQSALVDANTSESELKDYAHELIWELNKISPTILLYVLPELERELKVEDLSKRKSAVKLLGEMFSAEGSLLPTSYPQLFNTFISRFNDIEPDIRLLMIQYVPQFIKNHPASHKSINEALQKRLRDLDEKVREAAVVAVCESAIFDPQALTNQILQEIGLRMRDKKLSIRTAAITKLAVLYRELVEKWGPQISWKPSHQNKFGWIPNSILHCYYQTDVAIRLLVEQILAEELLPKGAEVEERTRILVNLLPSLDEHAVLALSRILKDKKTFQTEFQAYLKARSRLTKSDGDDRQIDEQITNRITSLANKLPGSTARFQALHNLKASQIWKGLALLADTDVEYQQVIIAEEDIFKGYRSKSSAGMEYLKLVVHKLSMNIVSQDCLPFLFAELKSLGKQSDQEKSAQAVLKFLKELSSTFPSLFKGSLSDLSTLLEDEDPLLVDTVLEIFASVGGQLKRTSRLKKTLEKRLCQFAMEGSVSQAKCAVKAIHSVCREDKGMLAKLMRNLLSLITDPSKVAPSALQSLAQLAKMDADTFLSSPSQDRIVAFVMEELIVEAFPKTKNSRDKPSKLCIKKVLGMKLLVNYLRACHDAEGEDVDLNVPKQALELAYDIIEKNGEIVANTSTADAEKLVQCASSSILKLARYKYYDRLISPEQIQAIAMVLKHPSFDVRDAMLDELWKGLKDLKLPLKYLSFFALAALDPQRKLAHKAKSYLTACIRVRREKLKALSSSNKSSASILPALLPEYALPYLIHLLAHRKDWKEDTPHYTNSAKYLIYFLEPVLSHGDNFTFLRQLLGFMMQTEDAQKPSCDEHIRILCEIALRFVEEKSNKKAWSDHTPSTSVYLPRDLFILPEGDQEIAAQQNRKYLPADFSLPTGARHRLIYESAPAKSTDTSLAENSKRKTPPVAAAKQITSTKRAKKNKMEEDTYLDPSKNKPTQRRTSVDRKAKRGLSLKEHSSSEEKEEEEEEEEEEESEKEKEEEGVKEKEAKEEMETEKIAASRRVAKRKRKVTPSTTTIAHIEGSHPKKPKKAVKSKNTKKKGTMQQYEEQEHKYEQEAHESESSPEPIHTSKTRRIAQRKRGRGK